MTEERQPGLEDRLFDLGTAIAFPTMPPLSALVAGQLGQPRRGLRLGLGRPVSRGVALALAATLLLVGIAAAFGIGLGGLRLVFGPAPSPLPSMAVGPGLGEPTTLAEARSTVSFSLRLPGLPELGNPDLVYLAEPPAGGAVTLLYREREGFPADPVTNIGLIVTQFRADIAPESFEKLLDSGVRVTPAKVDGLSAWWVAGGEHFFFYRDAQGRVVPSTLRLASDTLIWEEEGVTYRVEGALSLEDAVRVAESLE
jgi:hypothetical protein